MALPENIRLQASVNGGGPQTGAITALNNQTVALSLVNPAGVSKARYEIYEYPEGWPVPAGWTEDTSSGVFYVITQNGAPAPTFTLPSSASLWGKFLFSVQVNDRKRGGVVANDLYDESTAIQILSPTGLKDVAYRESNQFDLKRKWVGALKHTLRLFDAYGTGVALTPGTDGQFLLWDQSQNAYKPGRVSRLTAVGVGVLAGLVLHNPDPSTGTGDPKYSPSFVQQGESFTTVPREVFSRVQTRSSTDGATVTPRWVVSLGDAAEGTAPDAATLTDQLELTTSALDIKDNNFLSTGFAALSGAGSYVAIGDSGVATSGSVRLKGDGKIRAGGATEYDMLTAGFGGTVIGSTESAFSTYRTAAGSVHAFEVNALTQLTISETAADFQNNNIVTTGLMAAALFSATNNINDASGATLQFIKRRAGGAVQAGDALSAINTYAHDGTSEIIRGQLIWQVTGAVSEGNVPTALTLSTGSTSLIARHQWFANGSQSINCDTGAGYGWLVDSVRQVDFGVNAVDFHSDTEANFALKGRGEAMIGLNIAASGVRNLELFGDGSGAVSGWDNALFWAAAVLAPRLSQAPSTGNAETLLIQAQSTSGTIAGSLNLFAGFSTNTGSPVGGDVVIKGGNAASGSGTQTGGSVQISGGECTGATGTRIGGTVVIAGGLSASGTDGVVEIRNPAGTKRIEVSATGIGFYATAPVAQPSSTGETAGFTAGTGTAVNDDSTFTGNVGTKAYRISDVVRHLKNLGLLASS